MTGRGDSDAGATELQELVLLAPSEAGQATVRAMAAPDGTVTVVKILDGSPRASRAVALSLLTYVGAVSREEFTEVLKRLPLQIYGGGSVVGDIRVSIPALLNQ